MSYAWYLVLSYRSSTLSSFFFTTEQDARNKYDSLPAGAILGYRQNDVINPAHPAVEQTRWCLIKKYALPHAWGAMKKWVRLHGNAPLEVSNEHLLETTEEDTKEVIDENIPIITEQKNLNNETEQSVHREERIRVMTQNCYLVPGAFTYFPVFWGCKKQHERATAISKLASEHHIVCCQEVWGSAMIPLEASVVQSHTIFPRRVDGSEDDEQKSNFQQCLSDTKEIYFNKRGGLWNCWQSKMKLLRDSVFHYKHSVPFANQNVTCFELDMSAFVPNARTKRVLIKDIILPFILYTTVLIIYTRVPGKGITFMIFFILLFNLIQIVSMVKSIYKKNIHLLSISQYSSKVGSMNHKRLQFVCTTTGMSLMVLTAAELIAYSDDDKVPRYALIQFYSGFWLFLTGYFPTMAEHLNLFQYHVVRPETPPPPAVNANAADGKEVVYGIRTERMIAAPDHYQAIDVAGNPEIKIAPKGTELFKMGFDANTSKTLHVIGFVMFYVFNFASQVWYLSEECSEYLVFPVVVLFSFVLFFGCLSCADGSASANVDSAENSWTCCDWTKNYKICDRFCCSNYFWCSDQCCNKCCRSDNDRPGRCCSVREVYMWSVSLEFFVVLATAAISVVLTTGRNERFDLINLSCATPEPT